MTDRVIMECGYCNREIACARDPRMFDSFDICKHCSRFLSRGGWPARYVRSEEFLSLSVWWKPLTWGTGVWKATPERDIKELERIMRL